MHQVPTIPLPEPVVCKMPEQHYYFAPPVPVTSMVPLPQPTAVLLRGSFITVGWWVSVPVFVIWSALTAPMLFLIDLAVSEWGSQQRKRHNNHPKRPWEVQDNAIIVKNKCITSSLVSRPQLGLPLFVHILELPSLPGLDHFEHPKVTCITRNSLHSVSGVWELHIQGLQNFLATTWCQWEVHA